MKKKTASTLLLFALLCPPAHGQLVINELMQSNVDCLMDDLNDFPDSWVELYNAGDTPAHLGDYRLGKTPAAASAWRLPALTVSPGGHVVVFCDKVGRGLHADFRLESGSGCSVFLLRGEQTADAVTGLRKQPAPNTAYGRRRDGSGEWGYMTCPTPGASNGGVLAQGTLSLPLFSPEGGVQTVGEAIVLRLSIPAGSPEGTCIRYTTDGSEPTAASTAYEGPLTIAASTVVRARLFCDGWLSPPSACHSYLFFPTDRPLTLPVVSIVTDDRYLNDSLIGIYVEGRYQDGKPNYRFNWRRPINIELFETGHVPAVLNQLCETRIFGGSSRDGYPRSLVVYANKRFGSKRLDYEFFPDQRPGITDYKSIALRNSGQDFKFLYLRDALCQRNMAMHADLDWQAWRPAIVYFNGDYVGMLNLRDRSNEDNVYTYHGGLEDIDLISNFDTPEEGTADHFNAFRAFYSEAGHTMAEYGQWMDCDEFINIMAMNIFHANLDFPGNNSILWRPRSDGGRWRFIAKDMDYGMGLYNITPEYAYLEWLYTPGYDSIYYWGNRQEKTLLFRHLMDDDCFRQTFISRFAVYMGDFLNERGLSSLWAAMYDRVKTEQPFHWQHIGRAWQLHEDEVARVRKWLSRRPAIVYRQLASHYGLGEPTPLVISKMPCLPDEGATLTVNGIAVDADTFDGMYFAGSELTITATATDGSEVTSWCLTAFSGGSATESTVDKPVCTITMPACDSLVVTPIATGNGIDDLSAPGPPSAAVYSLQGMRLARMQKGLNIVGGRKIWN